MRPRQASFPFSFLFFLGPVCVASIAGPYRKGKSYVLSEAFSQPQVFPLGHHFTPETMGIWLWIVPGVFKVNVILVTILNEIPYRKKKQASFEGL